MLFHSIRFGGDKEIRNKFIEISFQRKFIHLQRENDCEAGMEGRRDGERWRFKVNLADNWVASVLTDRDKVEWCKNSFDFFNFLEVIN